MLLSSPALPPSSSNLLRLIARRAANDGSSGDANVVADESTMPTCDEISSAISNKVGHEAKQLCLPCHEDGVLISKSATLCPINDHCDALQVLRDHCMTCASKNARQSS